MELDDRQQSQETEKILYQMKEPFRVEVDRTTSVSVTRQIYLGIRRGIVSGSIADGSRLASWQDLAVQLGVSRGTVKRAYDLLKDEQLVFTKGSGGTWVSSDRPQVLPFEMEERRKLSGLFYDFEQNAQYFQLGVPAQDEFPFASWNAAWRNAITSEISRHQTYPDPRGLFSLRREIAGYLATARGIDCRPSQIFVTAGFTGALGIVLNILGGRGESVFVEDPGFPRTRTALGLFGLKPIPLPVDSNGVTPPSDVLSPSTKLLVVTPGQQAPLGMTLSEKRRSELLDWAGKVGGWIIEDDYSGELQSAGRASSALAARDNIGRVVHVGSFSKTLTPGLRLGYLVVPEALIDRFEEFVSHFAPAGSVVVQQALRNFIAGGHYLRHLRKIKKVYAERKDLLVTTLRTVIHPALRCEFQGTLSVRLFFPPGIDDIAIAQRANERGLGVLPLSIWYQSEAPPKGLLLGISNTNARTVRSRCEALSEAIHGHTPERKSATK